jgi:alpha-glucosidase
METTPAPIGATKARALPAEPWWRRAVVYEVYPRSFADSNGDGQGDLEGLRGRLPYLADLGVDAVWIAPWYPSPMADGGYDVSDYRDIHPMFGTLGDADRLVADAHRLGLRLIIDLVANHTSSRHLWFQEALAAAPGSAARARYIFRDGRGADGELPPNNWISAFDSSAWTRVIEPDGRPGQWYLHTFDPQQPDLDWTNAEVRDEFDAVLRFWFDRGVDGIRVDAAPAMAKVPGLPDAEYDDERRFASSEWVDNPHWDVDAVHEIFRRWRAVADEYDGDRMFVAEAVVRSPERLTQYLRPNELHTAFNFSWLKAAWGPGLREVVDATLASHASVGASPTWALGSHDETRLVTRLGRDDTAAVHLVDPACAPSDRELGTRRAAAATLLMLALPGSAYLYQGDELGLPFVADLPADRLEDPVYHRSGGTLPGRDGSRVPMPWSGHVPPFGFSADGIEPWLPQPADWAALTVEAQLADPGSMLSLVRRAVHLRRELTASDGDLAWSPSGSGVLDFTRGAALRCVVNFSSTPIPLDPSWSVVVASNAVDGGLLPPDSTAWLTR